MNATQFLNMTTVPTCSSLNVATTVPYVALFLHLHLLIPTCPQTTFEYLLTVTIRVIYTLWRYLLHDSSNQSSSQPWSGSNSDNFTGLFLMLSEGSRWRACRTAFIESAVVYGSALGLHVPSVLTQ